MVQLARVQLRSLPQDGGHDLLAMSDAVFPAFYAAHCRHFSQLLKEGARGPFYLMYPQANIVLAFSLLFFFRLRRLFSLEMQFLLVARPIFRQIFSLPAWFFLILQYFNRLKLKQKWLLFRNSLPRLPIKSISLSGTE